MSSVSGMEVADKIRKMDSDVFLIFVTNFSDIAEMDAAVAVPHLMSF